MPFDSPSMFIGLTGEFNHLIHNGSLDFVEDTCHCGAYKSGLGEGYTAGIEGEYWFDGLTAITFSALYNYSPGNFTVQQKVERENGRYLLSEFKFESKISYLLLEPGIKYRLFDSHFHIGGGIQFGILLSNSSVHKEKKLGDEYEPPFPTNPPSYERILATGKISELNNIFLQPKIRLGYDLTYGLGMYATPNISVGIPILNLTKSSEWRRWSFSAGLTVYWGI